MAMNQPPIPPTLLGPGGAPLQMKSNFRCPSCKHQPPVANNPEFPPGTPVAMITATPGDTQPQFNCLMCWNKFWAKFIRRHAPALVPIADGVRYADEADEDEVIE